MDHRDELRSLITGLRISAALSVAAELRVSDELSRAPADLATLAMRVGADPDSLHRLLRVLVHKGVYTEDGEGRYANSPLGEGLRSDVAGSMRPLARTFQDPATWAAWGHLAHSVRTGDTAFEALHGQDVWSYRAAHADANDVFNANMAALTSRIADAVAEAYDFSAVT